MNDTMIKTGPRGRILRRGVNANGPMKYLIRLSRNPEARRLLIAVHGISREPDTMIRWLAHEADQHGYHVVAPVFDRLAFPDFQRLGRSGLGRRADIALNEILKDVERFLVYDVPPDILGFSGGAQFAHRYAMAQPGAVRALGVASAGWYTMPGIRGSFPLGLEPTPRLPDLSFDWNALVSLPTLTMVGALDVERDATVRDQRELNQTQGEHRLDRAKSFHRALERSAHAIGIESRHEFCVLPNAGHDMTQAMREGGMASILFGFLSGLDDGWRW